MAQLEANWFRPFIDPWPQMAPFTSLGRAPRRGLGQVDNSAPATPEELDALKDAIDRYLKTIADVDLSMRQAIQQYKAESGSDELPADIADYLNLAQQQQSFAAQTEELASEAAYFGRITADGQTRIATQEDVRRIYRMFATSASNYKTLVEDLRSSMPGSTSDGILQRLARELGSWFEAFNDLGQGLKSLVQGVGQGVKAVSWVAPAVVVVGVGFLLYLAGQKAKKTSGV